jgi:cytochrome P450
LKQNFETKYFPFTDFYEKVMSKAACYDSLWMGNQFTVILNKPEDIQIALNSEKCFEKSSIYKLTFKYGLLTEGGEKYKDQRKSLKPLFSIQNLKNQIPKINEKFKYFLDKNSHFIECKGTPFEMQDFLSKFTLNTVMLTMFGIENHLSDDEIIELMEITNNFLKLSAERVSNPLLHLDLMFKLSGKKKRKITVLNRFWQIFTQHFLDKIQRKENKQPSYFECMEPHTIKMDQEELMETVVGFLGASFESTMVSISSILFLLASNPDKQEKLFDEVSSVLSSHEDEVTESIMNEMSYLDLVIKESLRLIPVGILIGRTATDDIEFSKFKLNHLISFSMLIV